MLVTGKANITVDMSTFQEIGGKDAALKITFPEFDSSSVSLNELPAPMPPLADTPTGALEKMSPPRVKVPKDLKTLAGWCFPEARLPVLEYGRLRRIDYNEGTRNG